MSAFLVNFKRINSLILLDNFKSSLVEIFLFNFYWFSPNKASFVQMGEQLKTCPNYLKKLYFFTEYDKGTILCPVKLAILIIAEFTFILGPLGPSGVIPIPKCPDFK